MTWVNDLFQIPILSIVIVVIIIFMLRLALNTYKSGLDLLQAKIRIAKIKIIIEERKLINNDKELEEIIKTRLDSGLTKSIEQHLGQNIGKQNAPKNL